jgi:hypothetical protein
MLPMIAVRDAPSCCMAVRFMNTGSTVVNTAITAAKPTTCHG